jgi:membrane-bound metal-dependent hydrolase YbcI (DUF457 family)
MYAIGHFALGYLAGKGVSKVAHVKVNLPLIFALSVIPDVDLLVSAVSHRGLTHSLIVIGVLSIPFFAKYKKAVLPYLAALLSHVLIGDFFTGGIELFWPITKSQFGLLNVEVNSLPVTLTELTLFVFTIALMLKFNDLQALLKPGTHNFLLVVGFGAVLGPLADLFRTVPNHISLLLVAPSLVWLAVFACSLFIDFRFKLSNIK